MKSWDARSGELPPENVYYTFAQELKTLAENRNHTRLALRMNYELPGYASLVKKTARKVKKFDFDAPIKAQMIDVDKDWADVEHWSTLKTYSGDLTLGYVRKAIDLDIKRVQDIPNNMADKFLALFGVKVIDQDERIHAMLFMRTFVFSVIITALCFLLGYPVSFLMAKLPMKTSNLLMILVLLPFWTSLLARTSAWKVMLQNNGVVNETLVFLGFVADDARLELINNTIGTVVAMTHILLPFMILPLYSVMRSISPSYVRAARSLGATEWTAFWRVYFPQSLPGIGAGGILVFILAVGYYITPELVGGQTGVFISSRIAFNIFTAQNWGLAASLGLILLLGVLAIYWLYDRVVGIDNMKLG